METILNQAEYFSLKYNRNFKIQHWDDFIIIKDWMASEYSSNELKIIFYKNYWLFDIEKIVRGFYELKGNKFSFIDIIENDIGEHNIKLLLFLIRNNIFLNTRLWKINIGTISQLWIKTWLLKLINLVINDDNFNIDNYYQYNWWITKKPIWYLIDWTRILKSKIPKWFVEFAPFQITDKLENIEKCSRCWHDIKKWTTCYFCRHWHKYLRYTENASKSKVTIWYEVEKDEYINEKEMPLVLSHWWACTNDGSIWGGEYISPVYDINEINSNSFKWLEKLLSLPAWERCWWHIHIQVEWMSNKDLKKNMEWWRPILWSLYPKRKTNRYCHYTWSWKYQDLHPHWSWTLEFRIFPAVEKLEDILSRTELLKFFTNNFAKNIDEAKSIMESKFEEFVSIFEIRINKRYIPSLLARIDEYYNTNLKEKYVSTSATQMKK